MRSEYELEFFDYEDEFPVRMAVVQCSATPVHLVIGYSHVLVDGAGIQALARDLEYFDRGGGDAGDRDRAAAGRAQCSGRCSGAGRTDRSPTERQGRPALGGPA